MVNYSFWVFISLLWAVWLCSCVIRVSDLIIGFPSLVPGVIISWSMIRTTRTKRGVSLHHWLLLRIRLCLSPAPSSSCSARHPTLEPTVKTSASASTSHFKVGSAAHTLWYTRGYIALCGPWPDQLTWFRYLNFDLTIRMRSLVVASRSKPSECIHSSERSEGCCHLANG